MNNKVTKLTVEDFERVFGETISVYVREKIKEYGFSYTELSNQERDLCVLSNIKALLDPNLISAGKKRRTQWDSSWGENLKELNTNHLVDSIIPKYFDKYEFVRFEQRFIKTYSKNFEYYSLKIILDWLFEKYFSGVKTIYEFGSGTGHNLFQLHNIYPNAELWGLDWAISSVELIKKFSVLNDNLKISTKQFDFFNPDYEFKLKPYSAIYTVAALEQVGANFKDFVNYLLKQKLEYCIHVEPIGELLDENNLLDWLSIQYFYKRNYLKGFLSHLQELEKRGKVEIIKAQRSYIGSLFIDGYSLIIWRPK